MARPGRMKCQRPCSKPDLSSRTRLSNSAGRAGTLGDPPRHIHAAPNLRIIKEPDSLNLRACGAEGCSHVYPLAKGYRWAPPVHFGTASSQLRGRRTSPFRSHRKVRLWRFANIRQLKADGDTRARGLVGTPQKSARLSVVLIPPGPRRILRHSRADRPSGRWRR